MIKRFFPWRFLLRLAARRYDFIDPVSLLARLRSFSQPSEVQEPMELLRAGMVFHARGLLNTKAIQHNLDWVWPYWIVRQFNPADDSFIPRSFSFSHINLTHRNWTAVGKPDLPCYPIVDPRGLVTPLHDGWSIDCWFLSPEGKTVFPSRLDNVDQTLVDDENRNVVTEYGTGDGCLRTVVSLAEGERCPAVRIDARLQGASGGWLIVALRPFNPEGVQFIKSAATLPGETGWLVNDENKIHFSVPADKILYSTYKEGDVSGRLHEEQKTDAVDSSIGMLTSAAFFQVNEEEQKKEITVEIPLDDCKTKNAGVQSSWQEALIPAATLEIPDAKIKFLYNTAVRTLVHLAADDIVPGPYTYNRFWFRDACLMLHPLMAIGLSDLCRRQIDRFARQQKMDGFFHSQSGEWDSNGQVLWLYNRYRLLSGGSYNPEWLKPIVRGGKWIAGKRVKSKSHSRYHGLLPPGFSAEHFGPNDYYYWDDFWAVAGLHGAADMLQAGGLLQESEEMSIIADEMKRDLSSSINTVLTESGRQSIPVSPNRRMDSGAIGSLVADYPLQLYPAANERMMATADYLMDNCLYAGCFFQDMIHSGINIYMTLMLAQVYLRAGDERFYSLFTNAADLASPTGQWPEAIHPRTGGGCMGDGQHGWAAAEWVMMIRNMFVFEEKDMLVIGRGIRPEWLGKSEKITFGPTLTPYGRVSIVIKSDNAVDVSLETEWYEQPPLDIKVAIPGFREASLGYPDYHCTLESLQ